MARVLGSALSPALGFTNWALSPLHPTPKPPTLPVRDAITPIPATPESQLVEVLQRLDAKKDAWAGLADAEKAKLLRACLPTTIAVSREAAEAAVKAKGSWGGGLAEELVCWVPVVSGLREYAEALEAGEKLKPVAARRLPDGQHVLDVFPSGLEALLFGGWRGEIWVQPGKEPTQGHTRAANSGKGQIALVLGAGNQAPVAPLDILHKLIAENEVVICKMNPVNEYLGPFLSRALAPLVDAGYVSIVYGSGKEGAFLCTHPLVSSILLTGSAATYDTIVWGSDKTKKKKALDKRVDGELGCVTPHIICPGGTWSDADIHAQAEQAVMGLAHNVGDDCLKAAMVVTGLVHNAGHNCLKTELVVTAAEWPQRQQFLAAVRKLLGSAPARTAYYPGSEERAAAFCKSFPDAEEFGGGEGVTPWRFKAGLTPDQADTSRENWCGVLQEVALPGAQLANPSLFLPAATAFANDRCWGNLSCSLYIHPEAEARHGDAYEAAVAGLRYGSVCINVASVMGFCVTRLSWGGFPSNTPEDIQSGNCATHNTVLVDHPQKSVLKAPWRIRPTPFWSPWSHNTEAVAPRAMAFMAAPSLVTMTPLSISALLC